MWVFVWVAALLLTLVGSAAAQDEKTLVYGLATNAVSLDPARGYEPEVATELHAIYQTLVTWPDSDNTKVVPGLADLPTVSADGLTYTFKLIGGAKFSNGDAVTGADVVFSFNRLKNIKGNPSFLAGGIAKVEAPDDATVVVTLSAADPSILSKLAGVPFSVLSAKDVKANGGTDAEDADKTDKAGEWLDNNSAGSGPYILSKWEKGTAVTLERNPNYAGSTKPYFDKVIFQNIPTAAAQKTALEAGDIDVAADITADQVADLQKNDKVKVAQLPTPIIMFLLFNQDKAISGPLSDPKVQLAVRYALDYEGIVKLTGGSGAQPPSIIPVSFAGALDAGAVIKRDVEKAKSLLKEAGQEAGFSIKLQYPEFTLQGVAVGDVAQKVQADLAEVNIKVDLAPGELLAELDNYRNAKEGLGLWWWGPDFQDALSNLEFLPNRVIGKRVNWTDANSEKTIQELRDKAFAETDAAKRADLVQQIQKYMQEKGSFAPLVQVGRQVAYKADLKGFSFNNQWDVGITTLTR
jgi:peptide/nickel transport system substrate-binding protein